MNIFLNCCALIFLKRCFKEVFFIPENLLFPLLLITLIALQKEGGNFELWIGT